MQQSTLLSLHILEQLKFLNKTMIDSHFVVQDIRDNSVEDVIQQAGAWASFTFGKPDFPDKDPSSTKDLPFKRTIDPANMAISTQDMKKFQLTGTSFARNGNVIIVDGDFTIPISSDTSVLCGNTHTASHLLRYALPFATLGQHQLAYIQLVRSCAYFCVKHVCTAFTFNVMQPFAARTPACSLQTSKRPPRSPLASAWRWWSCG
jgi:hypothetical protein